MKYGVSFFFFLTFYTFSQSISDYTVVVIPVNADGLPGFQSATVAYYGDEVLIIGGRLDGLHRRQPNVSFDSAGHNNRLFVVNLTTRQSWSVALDGLNPVLRDQLKATNHCYTQVNDTMIIAGGYGISEAADDHITFRSALKFSVSNVIDQVKFGSVSDGLFNRVEDSLFAETGGQLEYLDGVYYLVGGHFFNGRYNPRNGPSFTQTYSSEVRMFTWNGALPKWIKTVHNEDLLHKRDYNLVQIQNEYFPLVAFSGVFQKNRDLPFQTATRIDKDGTPVQVPNFRQFYNHYECSELVIFDPKTGSNHVVFLGGIAQYYDSLGILVQDNNVPFIETISRVEINKDVSVREYLLPTKMPLRYGAGVSFVPNKDSRWNRKMFEWNYSNEDSIHMGYLFGGISTVSRNIFWNNDGNESAALNTVYSIFLVKNAAPHKLNTYANNPIQLTINEHPKSHRLFLSLQIPNQDKAVLTVYDDQGKQVLKAKKKVQPGALVWNKFPKYLGWYRVLLTFENHPEWNWEQWMFYDE
jgi:hypothetical protein